MRTIARLAALALAITACSTSMGASRSDGWISLYDGQTLSGWRASENPATVRVENGEIVVREPRAHSGAPSPCRGMIRGAKCTISTS